MNNPVVEFQPPILLLSYIKRDHTPYAIFIPESPAGCVVTGQ